MYVCPFKGGVTHLISMGADSVSLKLCLYTIHLQQQEMLLINLTSRRIQ